MAEFKLGRIRFIWKSNWSTSTSYLKDDIIRYGGTTYICLVGHTSSPDFYTDLNDSTAKWQTLNSGVEWKDTWEVDTFYKVNDIVKYGGYLYIANTGHTSAATTALGLEDDQASWDLFAEGFDYTGNWQVSTRYRVNDLVKYGARIYLVNTAHTSAATTTLGLEQDQGNWTLFSESIDWKNNWSVSTRYVYGDVVKYGGQLYFCNTGHTSAGTLALGLENDQGNWDSFHAGIEYKGNWAGVTRYKINDVAKDGGTLYICTTHHTSSNVSTIQTDQANWSVFVPGLEFEDSWDVGTFYQIGDLVTYGGYTYLAKTNNNGKVPTTNTSDWEVFITGFNFRGDYGDDSSNQDYLPGDIVRVGGWTYLCILSSNGNRPPNQTYWEKLNEGFYWKGAWTDATFYDKGDVVSYNENSYVSILEHTSDETTALNRPDQINAGTNWNLMAGGAESNVLNTTGDLLYYSAAGPARLPIGSPGQVLVVNSTSTAPVWTYFGQTSFTYYVESVNGRNEKAPNYGVTIDRPWKSVRYGLEQIEQGAEYFNARNLIEKNRSFIQAEIVEWVDYQIANDIAPFTGAFTYDKSICRRDMGLIVDAIVYDLGHGGNQRSRLAALAYYPGDSSGSYITGQEAETVAAIEYGIEVITAVLRNEAPAANYQTLNAVGSPITQVIDTTFTEESTALSVSTSLIGIVTDAINNGNTDNIPALVFASKTLFVKTGEFVEVLPMIIPEYTAVVGDGLRSTRIVAGGSFVDPNDVPETLNAITRLRDIISDIIQNSAVSATTGNNETQITTRPAGSVSAASDAENLVQQIYDYIDYRINGVSGDSSIPATGGSNTPESSTGYTYATETLEANRDFIVAEITAYIADTYPAFSYDILSCERDINRYIDAIKYDLIYTGNYKSLLFARYYANSVQGSLTEDMFYLRNATGLRNLTVRGLFGTLGAANINGTKRPSAGAYASLDPGWGPPDEDVWIRTRSPYVQNVTTFGTGCVGLKVDGNLHNGGNDSIVANDFTQILSDGIGVWCTNLARTEIVSVFTYYCHIGYLSEEGGKIRATNGNNSYGSFGSVAEGVDSTETAITGKIDNRTRNAAVTNVVTDNDQIIHLEYVNAGQNYTNSESAILTLDTAALAIDALRVEGTYRGVVGTSNGSGTGQEFDITVNDVGFPQSVVVVKGGEGHVPGDTITISDSDLGSGGAANVTFDVDTIGSATRFTITGEGFGAVVDAAQIRDGGVYQVRLLNPDDSAENVFGGAGYVTGTGQSQGGTSTQITISATDPRASAVYVGMAIWIIGGTGTGQYAYIDTYNSATKIATVKKPSDDTAGWEHVNSSAIESALDATTEYIIEPRLSFEAPASSGITTIGRAKVTDNQITEIRIIEPGTGYDPNNPPRMEIIDPNETAPIPYEVRVSNGVLGQPTWIDRGTQYLTSEISILGDGFADFYQTGTNVFVRDLSNIPAAGSNIEFDDIPGNYYKVVNVRELSGTGPYSATIQISPGIEIQEASEHLDDVTLRIRYSQVRLTGHDFLDIGTGNTLDTNYPGIPVNTLDPEKETNDFLGGRVFYTSTDQDGNFRVGGLFNIEQSTGIATLNVEAFNISGLNELQLGEIEIGGSGTVITEFSTDGSFTANSDNIVPTQKAIKTYITSQIGSGAATLNVNSITAGQVKISTNVIELTSGSTLTINSNVDFRGSVSGAPLALGYFLTS